LVLSGWRLLSDELTLIDRKTGLIQPLPRPVSLKNQSIDVIRQFSPDTYINRASHDTVKGAMAHMRPPRDSVRRQHETARPPPSRRARRLRPSCFWRRTHSTTAIRARMAFAAARR
jgi:hypothetical protein